MTFILVWCENLAIFALEGPDMIRKPLTEAELRTKFNGNAVLNQWADFAKANPNKECLYDMLPA